jgi:hypothetical protein
MQGGGVDGLAAPILKSKKNYNNERV